MSFPWICVTRGGIWKGDIATADIEALEEMDASEIHARKLNAKEVLTPMKGDNHCSQSQMEQSIFFGEDQDLRTPTLIRDRPERGEEQEILRRESDGLSAPSPQQDDSTLDDAEDKDDFWSLTGDVCTRHHVEPRLKLCVPRQE